jgi:hypothetical protein
MSSPNKKFTPKYYWVNDKVEKWLLVRELTDDILPNGCIKVEVVGKVPTRILEVATTHCEKASEFYESGIIPEDLVSLPDVNQPSILHCTKSRFMQRNIYTSLGAVLMLINPFERIPKLYAENLHQVYADPFAEGLASHIYLVPSRAFYSMVLTKKSQSILISGESGAGKTEATKECLAFLTKKSQLQIKQAGYDDHRASIAFNISDMIIAASPILEAFGNAQTVRNANSSRFGKWLEISFDEHHSISGSTIVSYLLEKSRITQCDSKERNFHIFYQLIRSMDEALLSSLHLTNSSTAYKLLAPNGNCEAKYLDDTNRYNETIQSCAKIGFSNEMVTNIFEIIAAILHLGNITFDSVDDGEASRVAPGNAARYAAELLKISVDTLEDALCTRTMQAATISKSLIRIPLSKEKASHARDSLVRGLFEKLFFEIIATINNSNKIATDALISGRYDLKSSTPAAPISDKQAALQALEGDDDYDEYEASDSFGVTPPVTALPINVNNDVVIKSVNTTSIGLLDIFGFEIFESNSFEQLCINYCNEMLQSHFNYVIFTAEKNIYDMEGIKCETIEFHDNTPVIQTIVTLFKALDEEGKIGQGTSKSWYDKHKRANNNASATNKGFSKAAIVTYPVRKESFFIQHYAGNVEYNPINFLEKNSEVVTNEIVSAMRSSENALVKKMFDGSYSLEQKGNAIGLQQDVQKSGKSQVKGTKKSLLAPSQLTTKTISWKFQAQLDSLMSMLKQTDSHFIRCIKSNDACQALVFDADLVHRQLVYSGVFEIIKIQQSGLPVRLLHQEFVDRFKCLLKYNVRYPRNKLTAFQVLEYVKKYYPPSKEGGANMTNTQLGNTMIFFKGTEYRSLEIIRDDLLRISIQKIQAARRMCSRLKLYNKLQKSLKNFKKASMIIDRNEAVSSASDIKTYCASFQGLCGYPVLKKVVNETDVELDYVCERAQVIDDATEVKSTRTQESYDKLEKIIKKASTLELLFHPLVKECKVLNTNYKQSIILLNHVQHGDNLYDLSMSEISQSISSLEECKDLFQSNAVEEALATAVAFKNRVESELNNIFHPMLEAFHRELVTFDGELGHIVMPEIHQDCVPLTEFLNNLDVSTFECKDTRSLYNDLSIFIKLRDIIVPTNVGQDALDLIDSYELQYSDDLMQQQLSIFLQWGELHLSNAWLRRVLQSGYITSSAIGDEPPINTLMLDELVASLNVVDTTGQKFDDVLQLAKVMCSARQAFLAQKYDELEIIVESALTEQYDGSNKKMFEEFPEALMELHNCQWQLAYNTSMVDLQHVCDIKVMELIPIDSDNWSVLLNQNVECHRAISYAIDLLERSYAGGVCVWPKLQELLDLSGNVLSMRELLHDVKYSECLDVCDTLTSSKFVSIAQKYNSIATTISNEVIICRHRIKCLQFEESLHNALITNRAKPLFLFEENDIINNKSDSDNMTAINFIKSHSGDAKQLISVIKSVEQYLKTTKFAVPLTTLTILNTAKRVCDGRETLGNISHEEYYLSACFSQQWEKAYLQITKSNNDASLSISDEYMSEFSIITQELSRRYIISSLLYIVNNSVISGSLCGSIKIFKQNHEINNASFSTLSALIHREWPYQPASMSNIVSLAKLFIELRDLIVSSEIKDEDLVDSDDVSSEEVTATNTNSIWDDDTIPNLLKQISVKCGEMDGDSESKFKQLLLQEDALTELDFIKAEYSARKDIRMLKYSLTDLLPPIYFNPKSSRRSVSNNKTYDQNYGVLSDAVLEALQVENLIAYENSVRNITAIATVSKDTEDLLQVSKATIQLLQLVKESAKVTDRMVSVSLNEFDQLKTLFKNINLDSIEIHVFHMHTLILQLIKLLCDAIGGDTDKRRIMDSIIRVNSIIKTNNLKIPESKQVWIQTAIQYTKVLEFEILNYESDMMSSSNDKANSESKFLEIVYNCKCLDDYLAYLYEAPLHQVTSLEYKYENMFIEKIRYACKDAYSNAVKMYKNTSINKLKHTLPREAKAKSQQNTHHNYFTKGELNNLNEIKNKLLQEDANDPYGIQSLRTLGYDDGEIFSGNFDLALLWACNYDVKVLRRNKATRHHTALDMRDAGYTLNQLYDGGFTLHDLKKAQYTAAELYESLHISIDQLKHVGYSEIDILSAGYSTASLKSSGFVVTHLLTVPHISVKFLLDVGYSPTELRAAGVNAFFMKQAGITSCKQLRSIGYSCMNLKTAGFDAFELKEAGFTYNDLRSIGFHDERLMLANFANDGLYHDILTEFYRKTDGDSWHNRTNWCSDLPFDEWYGIKVDQKTKYITQIVLPNNNLRGHITSRIQYLAELQTLNLSNNRLTGTIPAALSSMINLSSVNLAGNDELRDSSTMLSPGSAKSASPLLTPSFVNRNITSHHSAEWNILMDLFQDSNGKQWSIRTNWGSDRPLSDWHGITLNSKGYVKKIVIHNNNIDGCIPDSIRGLQYLQVLDLRFNCINGCIPESICELSSLTHIHLHGNRLQGEIPQSIGYLSMLKVLDVRSNALCGDIPQSLSLLNNLWYLGISSNNFTLTVSLKEKKEICRLTNTKEASVKSYAKFLLPTLHSIE